ncbi:MAG: hypothetical protein K6U03_04170 [Firmicutes bacterium]|nr:hypothetical protein [Bacillota bacterium]
MILNDRSYVFILGAGAAKPYGFPLGVELYREICKEYPSAVAEFCREAGMRNFEKDHRDAKYFAEQLALVSGVSIDRYVNINPGFGRQGGLATVTQICKAEAKSHLPGVDKIEGDWYKYLFQRLTDGLNSADDLLRIGENRITFITFNYDRSLEHYLFENLFALIKNSSNNKITREHVAKAFKSIRFFHVYGQIGKLPWQAGIYDNDNPMLPQRQDIVPYGNLYGSLKISPFSAALHVMEQKQIDMMYSSRKEKPELVEARKCIEAADVIMILT